MATTPTTKGKQIIYGAGDSAISIANLLIQSVSKTVSAETQIYKDETGTDCSMVIANPYEECTIEAIAQANYTLPAIGDTVSITGLAGTWYCTACSVNWSNTDAKRISLTVRTFPGITSAT